MLGAISDNKKKRGRPSVGSTFVGVRLPPDQLAALDQWIAQQPHKRGRPEAIREILSIWLAPNYEMPRDRGTALSARAKTLSEVAELITRFRQSDTPAWQELWAALETMVTEVTLELQVLAPDLDPDNVTGVNGD